MKISLLIGCVAAFAASFVTAIAHPSPARITMPKPVLKTYRWSEPVPSTNIQFSVPSVWHLAGRTLPRRNLYRDGDTYHFKLPQSHPTAPNETISVCLLLASGADIVQFKKHRPDDQKSIPKDEVSQRTIETVIFGGGMGAKNVWIKVGGKWAIINIEAKLSVLKHQSDAIDRVIRSITIVPRLHKAPLP